MEHITIQFHCGDVTLSVYVTEHLFSDGKNFGYIEVHDGTLDTKPVFWDNLNYFLDLNKEKKIEIKTELKENKQFYPGVVSDIKNCVKRAVKLGYLVKK